MSRGGIGPTWRKPAGMLAIVLLILVWVVLVASFSAQIGALPILLQLPVYVALGIVWILPLKPLLRWMETGRWRAIHSSPSMLGEGDHPKDGGGAAA